jgi:hypothetical protein
MWPIGTQITLKQGGLNYKKTIVPTLGPNEESEFGLMIDIPN